MKKDEIFILWKFQEKNNPTGHRRTEKKFKANLNLMKWKSQTEILKDKTTHYKTKYQEIDQELITEIRNTTIPKRTMGKELQKGGRKILNKRKPHG